jgi:predicted Rossmann fold nucleotide-binding protein DprA/Smf involved in DNA uptake
MKTIIAGSRDFNDYNLLKQTIIESKIQITKIVSGGCRGADKLGEKYAKENNIPCEIFNANWDLYGKSAGFRRNKEMVENADALIAVHINNSKGTSNTIELAKKMNLKVFVKKIDPQI